MHGAKTSVIPLALHKQLLLMECEVNRAQLRQDWSQVKAEAEQLKSRARAAGATLGKAALWVVAGYASSRILRGRRGRATPPAEGKSWWPMIVNGGRLGLAAWRLLRR